MWKCYIIITDLAISLAITSLGGNKPKNFDFVHQTISPREATWGLGESVREGERGKVWGGGVENVKVKVVTEF